MSARADQHEISPRAKALWQIHFCVVLWGFTAILGKLITLAALPLVWWRMILVSALLLVVPRVRQSLRILPAKLIATYSGIGCVVALHWLTFYGAIKLANASVAATCIALAPMFLAFVEPKIAERPFARGEVLFGIAVVPGVLLVVGGIPTHMRWGFAMGALSAFLVAIFGSLNKRFVGRADALSVTFIELGAGAILLTLLAPFFPHTGNAFPIPGARDAIFLGVLAIVCTLLPFALSLLALRELSAFGAQLAVNLEPVYAITLAVLLLGEQHELSLRFYAGVIIILAVVIGHPLFSAGSALKKNVGVNANDLPLRDTNRAPRH